MELVARSYVETSCALDERIVQAIATTEMGTSALSFSELCWLERVRWFWADDHRNNRYHDLEQAY